MSDRNENMDSGLVAKYLAGEANQEERFVVEAWISASAENQKEFLRFRKLWETSATEFNVVPADVNTDNAWGTIKKRISTVNNFPQGDTGQKKSKTIMHSIYRYAVSVAAAVILLVIGYILIFRQFSGQEKLEVVAVQKVRTSILPDSSYITLNLNSNISYPKKFKSGRREVTLSGEAYFNVKHIDDQPFVVIMKDACVHVLGTEFNIRNVAGEPEVTVTVTSGRVKFSDKDDISFVYLGQNEKGVLHRDSGLIEKFSDTDENELFWKTRTLLFRDTKLSVVFKTIEKIFKVNILVNNDSILDCKLTGKFTNASAEEILNKISLSFDLNVQKDNNNFNVDGNGCGTP
jgi:transmembrane sensor